MEFFCTSTKTGRFYVHGKLNFKIIEGGKSEDNWTHTICLDVEKNKFYDNTCSYSKRGRSIKKGLIPHEEGYHYMTEIHRIYRLEIKDIE